MRIEEYQLKKDFETWGRVLTLADFKSNIINGLLEKGFSRQNSRLVFSVCPDDINRIKERQTIEKVLRSHFNKEFHLGNLAGYPIGGIAGISAASHHPPDNIIEGKNMQGNLIFYISPHLGLSTENDLITYGRILRPGQIKLTNSCGAMIGFLKYLKKTKLKKLEDDINDPTKVILFNELITNHEKRLEAILYKVEQNIQLIELSKLNYELVIMRVKEMIKKFLKQADFAGKLSLIGGITINTKEIDFFICKDISFNL